MHLRSFLLASLASFCIVQGAGSAAPAQTPLLPPAPPGGDARPKPAGIQLITLDPGHFHAALIQREHYPNTSDSVHVYAPLGQDLLDHLGRISRFNQREKDPTHYRMEVHTGPDFLERMQREKPGNVVVISGRNRGKLALVQGALGAGLHVLVDKPWILESSQLGALKRALDDADARHLVAYDIMTERFELTNLLQRALVNDAALFGTIEHGSADNPAVYMESVHHLMKMVAGAPNIRPAWFFDSTQQGEGLSDIGTHLVDLVHWTLFPEQALDAAQDLKLIEAQRWPTSVSLAEFQRATNEKQWPPFLAKQARNGVLDCQMNNLVAYSVRGVHVRLNVIWDYEAPAGGGDTHFAVYRGSRARVEVRQGRSQNWRTELYVIPSAAAQREEVGRALASRVKSLSARYPGLGMREQAEEFQVSIPDVERTSHEAHFGEVARQFYAFVQGASALPAWEKPNMLAKYWLTTKGTELSRQGPPRVPKRRAPQ